MTDCYEPRLGGIECQVRQLAGRQQRDGHTVTVITCVAGPPSSSSGPEVVRPARTENAAASTPIRYWDAPKQLRAFTPRAFDAVHVHVSTFSPLAFFAARASAADGIPTVITVHSLLTGYTSAYRALATVTGARSWPVNWTAVSTVAADSLRAVLGQDFPVRVVHNAVDPCAWATSPRTPHAGLLRLVSVGRLAARKRALPLVRILHRARELTPMHIRLSAVLVGAGPQRAAIARAARRLDMDWLRLPGALPHDQIRAVHAQSDLYLAPARRESFGIAALEAHCSGLPVIGFRRTGIGDFIDDGVNGHLVPEDEAMARVIARLAQRPDELQSLGDGAGTVPAHVTWEAVTASWNELYQPSPHRPNTPTAARLPAR